MAKKPKAEKESVKPSEVRPQIAKKKLTDLLKLANSTYKDQRELSGTLGQKIAEAAEKENLNRKAFNIIRGFDRMTPEKLADTWDTLQYYMDVSGLAERAASAPRLDFDDGEQEGDGEDHEAAEAKKSNVAGFPAANRAH